MTDQNGTESREEVLFAFHQACNDPTPQQIIEWVKRFPQFADDIRAHAALLKDWADREGLPVLEPDEMMLLRSRSRAVDALHRAKAARASGHSLSSSLSFEQMMAARRSDVPQLARRLDIARSVLAALVSGRMLAPVGKRLISALMDALGITRDAFDHALQAALAKPRIGQAKAEANPTVIPLSYEELVRASSMTVERKRYWLNED